MTAYLQPGDKIHITVPADWGSRNVSEAKVSEAIQAYEDLGVEVFLSTVVSHTEQARVVAVIREKVKPTPPAPPQIPLIHEPGDKFRAHWSPPPWQESPEPHPGYQDHPRVP